MAKGGYWVPGKLEDIEIIYSYEKHSPISLKGTPWLYCKYCGLLYLRNDITQWCIRMGCSYRYHPTYKRTIKRLCKIKK